MSKILSSLFCLASGPYRRSCWFHCRQKEEEIASASKPGKGKNQTRKFRVNQENMRENSGKSHRLYNYEIIKSSYTNLLTV